MGEVLRSICSRKVATTKLKTVKQLTNGAKCDNNNYYMAESFFAMRVVNLRSVTRYTDQNFKANAHFGELNLLTSENRFK